MTTEINKYTDLHRIKLRSNQEIVIKNRTLSSKDFKSLRDELSSLRNKSNITIQFERCSFNKGSLSTLSEALSSFNRCKLQFYYSTLEGRVSELSPISSKLVKIDFKGSKLGDDDANTIGRWIRNYRNTFFSTLHLEYTKMSNNALNTILLAATNNHKVRNLFLNGVDFDDSNIKNLSQLIRQHPHLMILGLVSETIKPKQFELISNAIASNARLAKISFSHSLIRELAHSNPEILRALTINIKKQGKIFSLWQEDIDFNKDNILQNKIRGLSNVLRERKERMNYFFNIVKQGDIERVRYFCNSCKGIIDTVNKDGKHILLQAVSAKKNRAEIINILYENKYNVLLNRHGEDKNRTLPLHQAIRNKDLKTVEALLSTRHTRPQDRNLAILVNTENTHITVTKYIDKMSDQSLARQFRKLCTTKKTRPASHRPKLSESKSRFFCERRQSITYADMAKRGKAAYEDGSSRSSFTGQNIPISTLA